MSAPGSGAEILSGQLPQPTSLPPPPPPPPALHQQQQQQQQSPMPQQTIQSPQATAVQPAQPYSPPPTISAFRAHSSPSEQFASVTDARPKEPAPQAPMSGAAVTPAQAPNPRQRSSIACLHCRRSKIRCVNTGIDTQCNACRNAGRECRYSVEISKRGRPGEDDAERTPKRPKGRSKGEVGTVEPASRLPQPENIANGDVYIKDSRDTAPSLVEDGILNPEVLTSQTWSDLFGLFETHYGTDLPFLHAPTFSKRLRELPELLSPNLSASDQNKKVYDPSRKPGWELLVLGILALTARFHPSVVRHLCAARPGEPEKSPVYASEHYATVLRSLLVGSRGNYIGTPALAKIQGLLMLGLYEWGLCNGVKAWMHVGLAIRMAQAMGLQFEDEQEYQPLALSSAARVEALHFDIGGSAASNDLIDPTGNDAFIEEEIRRRTFWSCFIMDRYLSSGKYRPSMLMLDDILLQLPCSKNHFLFGDRVCTALIDGTCSGTGAKARRKAAAFKQWKRSSSIVGDRILGRGDSRDDAHDSQVQCEYGTVEGAVSIHVRMVEIWGRIAKWTCAGGIRTERYPPWHNLSKFSQMDEALRRFRDNLPRLYRFSKMNIDAHISNHTSSSYILLQLLYSICTIILHRELMPFVPLRCDSPQGPLDYIQNPSEAAFPPKFYVESARTLFNAVRDITDLVQICQGRCTLPETPIMGFGLYIAALMEVYALNFPHMDIEGFVSGRHETANQPSGGTKALIQVLEIINTLKPRIPMADCWFRTVHRVHRYYRKVVVDLDANPQYVPTCGVPQSLNLRNVGGGQDGTAPVESTLKKLGMADDEDVNSWTSSPTIGNPQPQAGFTLNGNEHRPAESHRQSDVWAAVNTTDSSRAVPSAARPDYPQYSTNTPSHTSDGSSALQLPGLSRGNTPTPSAASTSPYQGPGGSANQDDHLYATQSQGQQQLAHHVGQPGGSMVSHGTPHAPPLPTHSTSGNRYDPTQPTIKIETPTTQMQPEQSGLSGLLADLGKYLGGDDCAAFMDGVSCEEWMEAASRAALQPWMAASSSSGRGMVGRGGMGDGWLSRVWRC